MEKFNVFLEKALGRHWLLVLVLTIVSASGLTYVFVNGMDAHPIAYGVYVLSFYTLLTVCYRVPPFLKAVKAGVYKNRHAALYFSDKALRARISLYSGTVINLAYAVFKFAAGVYYRSTWFGAVALYYFVACLIRYLLVRGDRQSLRLQSEEERYHHDWRSYRITSWLLLMLNATMTGMVFQMIHQNESYSYPGFVIYASAGYTFYRLTMASIRMVKIQKDNNPVWSAVTAMDLSVALMAIFALQTAMFSSFGGDMAEETRQLMNAITGGCVCFLVVLIAVIMLYRAHKAMEKK